jgi:hypothetical protein
MIDYYLKSAATHAKLEIFDAQGNLLHRFSSDERKEMKRPPVSIAERWFPKPQMIELSPGMHRLVWDLSSGMSSSAPDSQDDEEYGAPRGPRVVPGAYDVRLTVDGKTVSKPLRVAMDPRSTATSEDLRRQYSFGQQIFADAMQSRIALTQIRLVQSQLTATRAKLSAPQSDLGKSIDALQEVLKKIVTGTNRDEGMGLDPASRSIASALRVVEGGDRPAPSQAIAVFEESSLAAKLRIKEWNQLRAEQLSDLNNKLRLAGLSAIQDR